MSPNGILLSSHTGRWEGAKAVPVCSRLLRGTACMPQGSILHGHGGTLCRDAPKGMHGTKLWAGLKAKYPSLLDWVRRTWVPRHAGGPLQEQAGQARRELPSFRVGLRDRTSLWEQSCMCIWGTIQTLMPCLCERDTFPTF